MRIRVKLAAVAMFCSVMPCMLSAQASPQEDSRKDDGNGHSQKAGHTLTRNDGLSIVSTALDSKARRDPAHDCSHLVHAIYERAGFPYVYASSDDLYDGVAAFRRVSQPHPGDIVVWHGHAGIVVQPSRHVFFSFLSDGPGTDDYHSRYWVRRGKPRFYRYIKNGPCTGCMSLSARQTQ